MGSQSARTGHHIINSHLRDHSASSVQCACGFRVDAVDADDVAFAFAVHIREMRALPPSANLPITHRSWVQHRQR